MEKSFLRLGVIFVLGFASGLPMALLSSTYLAWFSSHGLSVAAVASLSLLGFPYVFRMLWSPLVDRYYLPSIGRRRSWLLICQWSLSVGFAACAFFSPSESPVLLSVLGLSLSFISATQDTVIDAHRTEYIALQWHGLAASVVVTGYRVAILLSGGVALLIAQYVGWSPMFLMMAMCMACCALVSFLSTEPTHPHVPDSGFFQAFWFPCRELAQRPYFFTLLSFIFFFKLGEAFTSTTSGIVIPFLIQGLELPLDTIAYVNKVMGVFAIIVGGLFAGVFLLYRSLFTALMFFGLLQAMTNIIFVFLAQSSANIPLFMFAVVSDNLAAGMGTTALVALLMRLVDARYTATQFSLLVALATVPRVFLGPFAAWLQAHLGWVGLYEASVVMALAFIPFLRRLHRSIDFLGTAGTAPQGRNI